MPVHPSIDAVALHEPRVEVEDVLDGRAPAFTVDAALKHAVRRLPPRRAQGKPVQQPPWHSISKVVRACIRGRFRLHSREIAMPARKPDRARSTLPTVTRPHDDRPSSDRPPPMRAAAISARKASALSSPVEKIPRGCRARRCGGRDTTARVLHRQSRTKIKV